MNGVSARHLPDSAWRRALRRALLGWYEHHARDLPWRRNRDPYRVWISEIMLQQTQVATVRSYFERFVERFPNVAVLAAADEADVLRLWEGLGYYRRARQMHLAARQIVEQHGGVFPDTLAAVLSLPGVGRYTAGAILSIALNQRQPILEANTLRLYSRLLAYTGDPRSAAGQQRLWEFAEQILPRRHVGRFNQALMELGSEICRPRSPACAACPLAELCPTRARGCQDRIPAPAKRPVYESLSETAVIVRKQQHVLLRQCGPTERWAGLWDFPRFGAEPADGSPLDQHGSAQSAQIARRVQRLTGIEVRIGQRLQVLKHAVTRFRITLHCYSAEWIAGKPTDPDACRWVSPAALSEYPLSTTGRKLSRWTRHDP
jgi:A/G-specific adenine glycosylase